MSKMIAINLLIVCLAFISISYCKHKFNVEKSSGDYLKKKLIISKLINEDVCREKLNEFVRNMCSLHNLYGKYITQKCLFE